MRVAVSLALVACMTPGCHETHGGGGAGAKTGATTSATTEAAPPMGSAPATPAPKSRADQVRQNPMVAYTTEVVNKYDAKTACLAVCAAALRCRSERIFGGGSPAVADRLKACRAGCGGAFSEQEGYLAQARTCLSSGDCAKYEACVAGVMPPTP